MLVSPRYLLEKLQEHAFKIDSLLAKDVPVKQLTPLIEERVVLMQNSRYYAKIGSETQPLPLKVHVELRKGIGHVRLYISQRFDRPNKSNCDKEALIQKRESIVTFSGHIKQDLFTTDFIYISVESEKDAFLILTCSFGKSRCMRITA
ncbi:MAG: hypothetical protein P4M11_02195 [Candidatus Pacebacteria bacterium]|nr:hypothetical protein [Candidatus Paceibacterota bacterium]